MSELSICFKVIRHPKQDSQLRWSVFAPMPYEVAYKPGRRTTPLVKETKLYAFASLKEAMEFYEECRDAISDSEFLEVWIALAENAEPCHFVSSIWIGRELFDIFWGSSNPRSLETGYWVTKPPPGTIESDAVTLIQCIERSKGTRESHRYVLQTSEP